MHALINFSLISVWLLRTYVFKVDTYIYVCFACDSNTHTMVIIVPQVLGKLRLVRSPADIRVCSVAAVIRRLRWMVDSESICSIHKGSQPRLQEISLLERELAENQLKTFLRSSTTYTVYGSMSA